MIVFVKKNIVYHSINFHISEKTGDIGLITPVQQQQKKNCPRPLAAEKKEVGAY